MSTNLVLHNKLVSSVSPESSITTSSKCDINQLMYYYDAAPIHLVLFK